MLDENEHSRKEDGRSLRRLLHKAEQQDATVVVDSAAFFSELPPEQAAPLSMETYREQQFDRLADGVRLALDMDAVYAAMGLKNPKGASL